MDNALPFKPGILEIQDQANPQLRNAEIIQHPPAFVIGESMRGVEAWGDANRHGASAGICF